MSKPATYVYKCAHGHTEAAPEALPGSLGIVHKACKSCMYKHHAPRWMYLIKLAPTELAALDK